MGSLQEFITSAITFINNVIIPFIFALALLFFVYHAFRFFFLESHESEGREHAKRLAIYGIAAFVVLVSIWGVVNMLVNGLGIGGEESILPDYMMINGQGDSSHFYNKDDNNGFNDNSNLYNTDDNNRFNDNSNLYNR